MLLGNGISKNLKIYEHDDSFSLAQEFCQKHTLNDDLVDVLSGFISQSLEYEKAAKKSQNNSIKSQNPNKTQNCSPAKMIENSPINDSQGSLQKSKSPESKNKDGAIKKPNQMKKSSNSRNTVFSTYLHF
jgi:hypothetical protein